MSRFREASVLRTASARNRLSSFWTSPSNNSSPSWCALVTLAPAAANACTLTQASRALQVPARNLLLPPSDSRPDRPRFDTTLFELNTPDLRPLRSLVH